MSEPTFTPAADVIEVYKDGSGSFVAARAGQPIAWAQARELGLVIGDPPAIDPDNLDVLHGVDVPPGDLAHDLANPGAILDEEVCDEQGAVVMRAKQLRKRKSDAV